MKNFILGFALTLVVYACANGSKRPDFDKFPIRSQSQSIWQKCSDTYAFVCQTVCTKYTKKNKCKKKHLKIKKREVKVALDAGDVLISKALLMKLLRK